MTTTVIETRNQTLDIAKGIGILLVFLGHSVWAGGLAFGTIFSFHMPLFFFISGMLFKPDQYVHICDILKKVFMALIVPYAFFNAIGLLTWWLSPRFPHDLNGVLSSLYSVFISCHPRTNGPTWFLIALAEVQFSAWMILRFSKGRLLPLLTVAVLVYVCGAYAWGRWLPRLSPELAPFRFLSVMLALLYFASGYVIAKCNWTKILNRIHVIPALCIAFAALSLCALATFRLGRNAINYSWHPYLFIVTSALGIFAILSISGKITDMKIRMGGGLAYIGRCSLSRLSLLSAS